MKMVFITFFLFFFNLLLISQQVVDEKIKNLPDGRRIKLATTRREVNPIQDMLTPGHEKHKIILQDSINKSNFEVKYYIEEYQNGNLETKGMALHPSSKSFYTNELIINRMRNNMISIILQIPGFIQSCYIPSVENYNPSVEISHFKWKIFTETPFKENVPVFLIYSENPDKDTLEKNMDRLFQSPSFKTLKDKDKMVDQIKSVTNNFYLFLYDVILK